MRTPYSRDTELQPQRSRPERDPSFMAGRMNVNNIDARFCFASDVASVLPTRNHRSPHFSSRQSLTLIQRFALVSIATHRSDARRLHRLLHL